MKHRFRIPVSFQLLFWMTVALGIGYPLAMTAFAQLLFPDKANGSLVVIAGEVRGSRLLAQEFDSPLYFHARPSATNYGYVGSGGSNEAETNPALRDQLAKRSDDWRAIGAGKIPSDMLYASASGLDPDISLASALGQLDRVCAARSFGPEATARLADLIRKMSSDAETIIGPSRVDVVVLNAALATNPAFAFGAK